MTPKKNKLTKAQAQRIHAKRRARERYDMRLNRADLDCIVVLIKSGQSVLMSHKSNRVKEHLVIYNDTIMRVIYDSKRQNVITFLPKREG